MPNAIRAWAIACFFALAPQAWAFDVNTATAEELEKTLVGVGRVKAQAIVDYRARMGYFRTTDDLLKVPSVGIDMVSKNFPQLRLQKGKIPLPDIEQEN